MLKSCTTFRISALEIVEKDDIVKQDAAKNGVTAPHSPVSEHLLPQIEYKRKGDLLAGEANSTAELVREMQADRKAAASGRDRELDLRAQELEIKKLEIQREILRLSQVPQSVTVTEPVTDTVSVDIPVPPAVLEPILPVDARLCGHPTANGTCQRELKENEENGCWQHAPKTVAQEEDAEGRPF